MTEVGGRIRKLREEKRLTQSELAKILGFKTYTTVSKWESGENYPKGRDLKRLAEFFQVSSDYILGINLDNLLQKAKDTIQIPVLGTITCGEPILAEENIESYREEVADLTPSGTVFFLETKGDSMVPTIPEGSFVLIRQQEEVENNEIAAVLVNGDTEATLKRVKYQGDTMILMPDNKNYEPIIVNEDYPARIIGKAVKVSIDL